MVKKRTDMRSINLRLRKKKKKRKHLNNNSIVLIVHYKSERRTMSELLSLVMSIQANLH